jgi:hypothetical protein
MKSLFMAYNNITFMGDFMQKQLQISFLFVILSHQGYKMKKTITYEEQHVL